MKNRQLSKVVALLMAVIMLASALPLSVLAAGIDFDISKADVPGVADYQLISKRDWDLAPGIAETEIVLNNVSGTRRQVVHTVTVDMNNPYTKVIPGYRGMWPQEGNYGVESTSVQALNAEKLGYGNVVAATNCSLSWYNNQYYKDNPHLIGEPLGYSILNGELYANSQYVEGKNGGGVQTIIVINYDNHPITGEARPADMPKVWIRNATDPLTGWEEQAIPVLFKLLFWPDPTTGEIVLDSKLATGDASRTFVGVKADGTLVVSVSDGEQSPYSAGFNEKEMADYMLKMGCVIAANCDGGGSTTFCTQRPGEDLKVNCSLSDGGERPTTNTILIISEAPADGVFARAAIDSEYDYYTPGSVVEFSALGTDAVGTKVEIPADVQWAIKEDGMGTIANGVFTSNGTEGVVTAQMIHNGQVVGERSVHIVTPEAIYFEQPVVTIPFGKTVTIPVKASVNGGLNEIGLGENDITFTTTNDALGQFNGLSFTAVEEANAPADLTSTVTATLNLNTALTASVQLNLGKGSVVLWDFEGGQEDIDIWNVINNRKNAAHWDYELALSLADRTNGQVHDGNYSMRLETNGLSSKDSHSEQYAWIRMGVDGEALVLKNARSVGFWLYVPEDNIQCWIQGHYKTDSNGDGIFDTDNVVSMMESENVYYNIDESGWHYLSMDISAFEEVALQADKQYDIDPADGMTGVKGEFFLALVFHKAINNKLWQDNGSINGNYTYYMDNFTVDYSEAVEDRENPIIGKINLNGEADLVKRDVVTTTSNVLNLSAPVADQMTKLDANKVEYPIYNYTGINAESAKVYIDGVEVDSVCANGVLSANNITVADGYHRVKFEICDNAGNKSVMIRVIKVESGVEASTVKLVPADATLDRIPFGSIYWMNLEASAIETIQSVSTVIDLNNVNHWQLDHMVLADGFSAEYTIAEETNTATITITRTDVNTQTGAAVLAQLPVRILYFDTDIKTPGYTAETYWTTYAFWAQDMKMDVDMGVITYVDGYKSNVLNVFSNEEFHVDTEMYTSMSNMDKAYLAAHGATHVHTPAAIADQAPTCAQPGYTGRTFCEGCNSVVEWGTTIAATGHEYQVADGKLVCHCGVVSNANGLVTINGSSYYAVNGVLNGGWISIEDEWYYFDKTTFAGLNGNQAADNGIKFDFENGRLMRGTWQETSGGKRYWYGPGYYKDTSPETSSCRPYEIDGKTYLFNRHGYMQTGIAKFFNGEFSVYYDCGTDGAAVLLTGPHNGFFYKEGIKLLAYQLVEFEGHYYYVSDGHKLAVNTRVYLNKALAGTGLPAGYYEFDAEGRMILEDETEPTEPPATEPAPTEPDPTEPPATEPPATEPPVEEVKNGVYGDHLYINGVMQLRYQIVEFNGDYYYVSDGNKIARSVRLYLNKALEGKTFSDGTPMQKGYYEFDADGKMILKNGPIDGFFYRNGVKQLAYQLVEFEGNYYYISDGHKLAMNTKLYLNKALEGKTFSDGTPMKKGYYEFDAEGKMILKNGPIDGFFYKNGVKLLAYQLVEFEGHYYYISDGHKLAMNTRLYLNKALEGMTYADGTPMKKGYYEFDAEGKMILKNGPIDGFFYKNGVKLLAYQLVEFEGHYYYIGDAHKLAMNTRLYLNKVLEGTGLKAGYYNFDAEGRMILN